MRRFWEIVDILFLGLLAFETAVAIFWFVSSAPAQPGGGLGEWSRLPAWLSSGQLVLIGLLLFLSIRRSRLTDSRPSSAFLFLTGLIFLLLAVHRATAPVMVTGEVLNLLPGIVVLVFLAYRAGARSCLVMWNRFHRESVILLAGVWLYLFGAVGMEVLQLFFLRDLSLFAAGWKAFFEMSGGTVLLYGLLLFRRERDRWGSPLAPA